MIILDSTKTLYVALGEAATTNLPVKVSYNLKVNNTLTATDATTTTNGTSDVPIVASPTSTNIHEVKQITVVNADNILHTVHIKLDVSGTAKKLVKITLGVNEMLQYADGEGFSVLRVRGDRELTTAPNFALSAGTNSYSSGAINFSNSNNVSFGLTNNTQLTASWRAETVSFWEPPAKNYNLFQVNTHSSISTYNISFQRIFIPYYFTVTRLDMLLSVGMTAVSNGGLSGSCALYTRALSSLYTAFTATSTLSFDSVNQSSAVTGFGGNSAVRYRTFAAASWNITPGEYWFGNAWSASHGGGGTNSVVVSIYGQSSLPIQGVPGGNNDVIGLNGVYSTGSSSLPDSLHLTDIVYCHSSSNSSVVSYVYRQPHFMLYGSF
jgi:hypothetical protein